jgi:hypothetical protein
MDSSSCQDSSTNVSTSPGKDKLLYPILKLFAPLQEQRGDHKLDRAREITHEFESDISENDRDIIEERIAFAQEMKTGLDSKSAFSPAKLHQAREYRRASSNTYRYAKSVSMRVQREAGANHPHRSNTA